MVEVMAIVNVSKFQDKKNSKIRFDKLVLLVITFS